MFLTRYLTGHLSLDVCFVMQRICPGEGMGQKTTVSHAVPFVHTTPRRSDQAVTEPESTAFYFPSLFNKDCVRTDGIVLLGP